MAVCFLPSAACFTKSANFPSLSDPSYIHFVDRVPDAVPNISFPCGPGLLDDWVITTRTQRVAMGIVGQASA